MSRNLRCTFYVLDEYNLDIFVKSHNLKEK